MRGKSAFTLIELMVVVSIIGIVTALAIPNMNKYKTKAKMAEASIILPSIVKYQKAFYIENGYFKPLEPTARISN
ncbi:MAG: prepilin-type N-terminal cleavage/methylation domain-containing protein, partial [Deltaproteobacteria bacterium]|nr:prepilin-type N-terminal cleavage/methylation domain-containing protein [Deltaproteobacteria bacterium]